MENTSSGASENTVVKPATAADSQPSPQKEKRSTKKTKEPITHAEALQLLTSALNYCLESGLNVVGYNEGTALRLSIDGAQYKNNRIEPVTLIPEPSNDSVTKVSVNA
jgi:hypothetical protein